MTINTVHRLKIALYWLSLVVLMAAQSGLAATDGLAAAPTSLRPGQTVQLTSPDDGVRFSVSLNGSPAVIHVKGLCDAAQGREVNFTITSPHYPALTPITTKGFCQDGQLDKEVDLTTLPYGAIQVSVALKDQPAAMATAVLHVIKTPRVSTKLIDSTLRMAVRWPAAPSIQTGEYTLDLQERADCDRKPIQSFHFSSSSGEVVLPGTGVYFLCLSFIPSSGVNVVRSAPVPLEISQQSAPNAHPWGTSHSKVGANKEAPDLKSTSWISPPTKDGGCSQIIVFNAQSVYYEHVYCEISPKITVAEVIKGTYIQSGPNLELSPPTSTSCPSSHGHEGTAIMWLSADKEGNLYLFQNGKLYQAYFPMTPYERVLDKVTKNDPIAYYPDTKENPNTPKYIPGCFGGDTQNPGDAFTSMKPTTH